MGFYVDNRWHWDRHPEEECWTCGSCGGEFHCGGRVATHGQTIEWFGKDGSRTRVSSNGHPSPEAAMRSAMTDAVGIGYTKPKWWEWWRWKEIRYDA